MQFARIEWPVVKIVVPPQLLLRVASQRIQWTFRLRVYVSSSDSETDSRTSNIDLTFLFRHVHAFLLLLPLSTPLTIYLNMCHSVHLCMPFRSNWCFTLRRQQQSTSTSTICDLCGYIFNAEYSWFHGTFWLRDCVRLFIFPYQRAKVRVNRFAWTKKERRTLFEKLEKLLRIVFKCISFSSETPYLGAGLVFLQNFHS